MSTMLKSAAMSLLSKTLQSFLYKYLLEVDVEGVAMPSFMDVDGQHSGWGVRLCNVRLREGVELMTLPGKRKLKRTRRKTTTPRKPNPTHNHTATQNKGPVGKDSSTIHRQNRHNSGVNERGYSKNVRRDDVSRANSMESDKEVPLKTSSSAFPETIPEERTDSNISSRVPSPTVMCRTSASSVVTGCFSRDIGRVDSDDEEVIVTDETVTPEERIAFQERRRTYSVASDQQDDLQGDLEGDMEADQPSFDHAEDLVIKNTFNPSRPGRLVRAQKRPESAEDKEVRLINAVQESATEQEIDSNLSSRVPSPTIACRTSASSIVAGCLSSRGGHQYGRVDDEEEEIIEKPSLSKMQTNEEQDSLVQKNVIFDTKNLNLQSSGSTDQRFPSVSKTIADISEEDFVVKATRSYEDLKSAATAKEEEENKNGEHGDEHEEEEFEEEEYYVEEDMILQLGNGGRIGTLDVRLIGKDLHVTVEDAFLIVEACPKPEEADDASRSTAATADTTKDDASKAKKQKEKRKSSKNTAKKKEQPKTAGELVMENSPLARGLNAIPHLLLRDVRVQLVVKDGTVDPDDENPVGIDPNDTVVEVGIEMLSVTSGEDILAHIRGERQDGASSDDKELKRTPSGKLRPSLKSLEENDENEYLVKRIRTGKGLDGGISVRVYPPGRRKFFASLPTSRHSWAVCSFTNSSQFNLCRFSGIDLRARIFLGKKKDIAIRNNEYAWFGDEYDEYTMDSMLFGVDYIATDPPPLPPLEEQERILSQTEKQNAKSPAEDYTTDVNGIQSSKVRSTFHKVGRGLMPSLCKKDHLPCDYCPYCWANPAQPNSYSEHPLDSATPLPGTVLELTVNEPIEVNLDRLALEVIGGLQNLFVEKSEQEVDTVEETNNDESVESEVQSSLKNSGLSLREKMKSWAFRRKTEKKETLTSAFPSYMQPETIEVAGIHLAKIILRVHVMRDDGLRDTAMAFRYWESCLSCITVDLQKHESKEKSFIDVRGDVGYIEINDFGGVQRKKLLSLGLPHPELKDSDSISLSSSNIHANKEKHSNRPPWPSTAAALLLIPPPVETAQYASRERHSIQVRFISLNEGDDSELSNTTLNARVGTLNVDIPSSLPDEINGIISQSQIAIFGPTTDSSTELKPEIAEKQEDESGGSTSTASLMNYVVRIDGGKVCWSPLVQMRLPLTTLGGEVSSDQGVFFETVLNHVKVEYGKRTMLSEMEPSLSLVELSKLPESVRLRVLLFLKDLGPLEKALGIPREPNPFMRCRAVNKAFVKYGNRQAVKLGNRTVDRQESDFGTQAHRRQEILNEMMKLDDHELENLWIAHQQRSKL